MKSASEIGHVNVS